jgi:hypothetical protein
VNARAVAMGGGAAAFVFLALPGCAAVGDYFAARVRDTVDIAPVSVAQGAGLLARVRVTNWFDFGIGRASSSRAGWRRRGPSAETRWDERVHGGLVPWLGEEGWEFGWHEETKAIPFVYSLTDYERSDGETRQAGTLFTVIPYREQASLASPRTEVGSAYDVEAEVFLGIVGIRVAISPTQLFDWFVGWFGFDPLGDDGVGRVDGGVPCESPSD